MFAKVIGIGRAAAILIDMTVVRMVPISTAMAAFGSANRYLPAFLARLLRPGTPAAQPIAAGTEAAG